MSNIFIVTTWKSGIEHRAWFWESDAQVALDCFKSQPDYFLEDGYYTHIVIEEFASGYKTGLAVTERWYRVAFDPKTQTYAAPEECGTPAPRSCNYGLG